MSEINKEVVVETVEVIAIDPIEAKDREITKLKEERDNYKNVALKRLGKLPGDANFVASEEKSGLTIEEEVKKTILDREIARIEQEKEFETRKLVKENSELKLALKNRPSTGSVGGDSGSSSTVKDNVFSEQQLAILTERAKRLKADPAKFIEQAKQNISKRQ